MRTPKKFQFRGTVNNKFTPYFRASDWSRLVDPYRDRDRDNHYLFWKRLQYLKEK